MEKLIQEPAQRVDELAYWSNKFGISQEELTEALKAGKTSTEVIEKYVRELEPAA